MNKASIIFMIIISMIIGACNSKPAQENQQQETKTEENKMEEQKTLKAVLDERKARFAEKASDYKKKIYAEGIQAVRDRQVVENAMQVGDTAPDFTLANASGNQVSLYEQLNDGPVILMWYRGGWCPYCNLSLHYMQESLPDFKQYGANLMALTPELPDSTLTTQEKNELDFEILSDMDNQVAQQYKIVFKLTDEVADAYEKGFGLSEYNGNEEAELPLAATYIIGKDKVIKYAFLDADYRNRAEPAEVLNALKAL